MKRNLSSRSYRVDCITYCHFPVIISTEAVAHRQSTPNIFEFTQSTVPKRTMSRPAPTICLIEVSSL